MFLNTFNQGLTFKRFKNSLPNLSRSLLNHCRYNTSVISVNILNKRRALPHVLSKPFILNNNNHNVIKQNIEKKGIITSNVISQLYKKI